MSAGRWLCNACGHRFITPNYSIEYAKIPLKGIIPDDDPSLPRGQVIKYYCPTCGSGELVGAANSDPFKPKVVRRQ